MGDEHIGHTCHDEDLHKKIIERIEADPYARVIGMGDIADGRNPDHKYFDFAQCSTKYQLKNFIKECYDDWKKRIKPIAHKYIAQHAGNHDYSEKYGFPHVESICADLKIPFAGYRSYILICTENSTKNSGSSDRGYKIFSTHGYGGGRKSGSKINRIEDEAANSVCDIYAMGHTHYLSFTHTIVQEPYLHSANNPIIREHEKYFLNTGSFLKSYEPGKSNYAERFGYKPQKTGCVMLQLFPRQNNIIPHIIT